MENDLRQLKAIERRKKIRKYIRQGLPEIEMAKRLKTCVTTIWKDIKIIKRENAHWIISNRKLIHKDVKNILKSLEVLNDLDKETWKVYYEEAVTAKEKLMALEKIRQNDENRTKLLKLIDPGKINIEKMVYIEKVMPIMINKFLNVVLEYIPDKEKQKELLNRINAIDIEEKK